jgi:hypothetical protein
VSGCARCGHTRREHNIPGRTDPDNRLCSAPVGGRLCLCPRYMKPGSYRADRQEATDA